MPTAHDETSYPLGSVTLTELRARYRDFFYDQTPWWANESFMRVLPNERHWSTPTGIVRVGKIPKNSKGLPLAVDLAHAYVIDPFNPMWADKYFWCRDVDSMGQRVFVGVNGNGLELHRHLAITERWGVAKW